MAVGRPNLIYRVSRTRNARPRASAEAARLRRALGRQRAARAAGSGASRHGTDFAGVRYQRGSFQLQVAVGGGAVLCETYRDQHVAALVAASRRWRGSGPLNYPKRDFCLAASPPAHALDAMMQTAAGGGHGIRVIIKDSAENVRVRYVVERTLALEMATDRRAFGRRLVEEARERGGVVGNDDLFDELMARVDAADYEVLLGDRLRAEGFAGPTGDGRAAPRSAAAPSDDDDGRRARTRSGFRRGPQHARRGEGAAGWRPSARARLSYAQADARNYARATHTP